MRPVFFTTRRPCAAAAKGPRQWALWRSPQLRPSVRGHTAQQIVCMAHPRRVIKVAKQIEREIGSLFIHDKVMQQAICPERASGFDTSLSAVASVTEVQLTNDLQVAKVYVSVYSDDMGKAVAMQNLHRLAGYVRKHVGQTVRLRLTPEIRFIMDDSIERSERVAKLLKQMEQIRLGEAEPPPIALPEYFDDEDSDEDDLFGEEDGSSIGSVDLGFFGDASSDAKAASGGTRRTGSSGGGAGRGKWGQQQQRGQKQQGRQRTAAAAPALEDPDLFAPAGGEGFFDDEASEDGELSEAEVEEMLQHFKKQRAEEAKRRAG